jgi:hypothetical protein
MRTHTGELFIDRDAKVWHWLPTSTGSHGYELLLQTVPVSVAACHCAAAVQMFKYILEYLRAVCNNEHYSPLPQDAT